MIAWWAAKTKGIVALMPFFGGFLVKADSEGNQGPLGYNRTEADGANLLARALRPYGGIVMWRAFVYGNGKTAKEDRARQAYDTFVPLDGGFDDNVVVQIKNGPIDFQVREPISPLLAGALTSTNVMMEVQAAQEYTGQAIHAVGLVRQVRASSAAPLSRWLFFPPNPGEARWWLRRERAFNGDFPL